MKDGSGSHASPSNTSIHTSANAGAKTKEPHQRATGSTVQETPKSPSDHVLSTQDLSPAPDQAFSEKIWDDACESLEKDQNQVVKAHVKTLANVLKLLSAHTSNTTSKP